MLFMKSALSILLLLLASGCALTGAIAGKVIPAQTIPPKYVGLFGQSVGVMVWTDRGLQVDYPTLGLDLANSVDRKLRAQSGKDGAAELKEAIFPVQPASIARYQRDHPGLDFKNVTEVAPKLGVSRLIYLEVEDFATRAPASIDLYRGSMNVTLRVVEVTGGSAKVAYEENSIQAVYPPKVTDDGTPNGDDVRFYTGTVDAMSTQIIWRLLPHEEEGL